MPLFSSLKYPLPLSDYSRAKALYDYKRALVDGNIATMRGIEAVAASDEELYRAIESLRSPDIDRESSGIGGASDSAATAPPAADSATAQDGQAGDAQTDDV